MKIKMVIIEVMFCASWDCHGPCQEGHGRDRCDCWVLVVFLCNLISHFVRLAFILSLPYIRTQNSEEKRAPLVTN
jgi:hypothetical protein